jgi:hypothetical protein
MRSLWNTVMEHRLIAVGVAVLWLGSWIAMYAGWDPAVGLRPWMVGMRAGMLVLVGTLLGLAAPAGMDWDGRMRTILIGTVTVAVLDVIAFMLPDTVVTLFFGGQSDWAMAAIWFALLLVGWSLTAIVAAAAGGSIASGIAMARRASGERVA